MTLKIIFFSVLALTELLPMTAFADGYSERMNEEIWSLRVQAKRYASEHAEAQCGWRPPGQASFSDEIDPDNKASDESLFRALMMMLRLDQNARAISSALKDERSSAMTRAVDARNLVTLRTILDNRPFPSTEEIGDQGVNAALMLVAHADQDLDFQKAVMKKMEDEVAKGQLSPAIPMVLKSIRPQVAGVQRPSPTATPDKHASATKNVELSPSECYNKRQIELTNAFISERFPAMERN